MQCMANQHQVLLAAPEKTSAFPTSSQPGQPANKIQMGLQCKQCTNGNLILFTQQILPEDTPLPSISRSAPTLLRLGKVSATSDSQGGEMESKGTSHCACCMLTALTSRLAGPSGKGMVVSCKLSLSLLLLASPSASAAVHAHQHHICRYIGMLLHMHVFRCMSVKCK